MKGNLLAHLALLLWLPVGILWSRSMPPRKAALFIVLGAILFLPQGIGFNLPLLPPLGKVQIASLATLLGCYLLAQDKRAPLGSGPAILFGLLALSAIGTTLGNLDAARFGIVKKPGLGLRDALSLILLLWLNVGLPYFLGYALFRTPAGLRDLLKGLVIGALIYIPFVLFEARMSPQFHKMLYGYFQHDWSQMIRGEGFRAIVFMNHGLTVAMFLSQAAIAAYGIGKRPDVNFYLSPRITFFVVLLGLVSCRSMGALMYAILAIPLLALGNVTLALSVARAIAAVVILYPVLRMQDLIPMNFLVEQAAKVSEERALSLQFRFQNEVLLLEHARDRVLFGWGGYGRSRVFNDQGENTTVVDGEWIAELGTGGLMLFLVTFGAVVLPIFRASGAIARARPDDRTTILTATLMLTFTGLNLIPNAIPHSLPLLLAGAVAGTCAPGSQTSSVRN